MGGAPFQTWSEEGEKGRMLTSIHESVAFLFLLWTFSRRSGLAPRALMWKPETVTVWPKVDCYNLQSRKRYFFFTFLFFSFSMQEMLNVRNASLREFLGLFCRIAAVHPGKVNVLHGFVLEKKTLHHVHTTCTTSFNAHRNIWNAFTGHSVHAEMPRLLPHLLILRACVRRAEQQTKSRA